MRARQNKCAALKCTTMLMEVCDLAVQANMKPHTQELGVHPEWFIRNLQEPSDMGVRKTSMQKVNLLWTSSFSPIHTEHNSGLYGPHLVLQQRALQRVITLHSHSCSGRVLRNQLLAVDSQTFNQARTHTHFRITCNQTAPTAITQTHLDTRQCCGPPPPPPKICHFISWSHT